MSKDFNKGLAVGSTLGTDTTDGTATANDILVGKTAYVNGVKLTGVLPNYVQTLTIPLTVPDMPTESLPPTSYQQWASYPESPLQSFGYPIQCIHKRDSDNFTYLVMMPFGHFHVGSGNLTAINTPYSKRYYKNGSNWSYDSEVYGAFQSMSGWTLVEANDNIYTDSTFTAVSFAKTTA